MRAWRQIAVESCYPVKLQRNLSIMEFSLRVLTALKAKSEPDPADVVALREYLGTTGISSTEELACAVIQKALWEREALRAARRSE